MTVERGKVIPLAGVTRKSGRRCSACQKFGTFAPGARGCDRRAGALPLVFIVAVTVVVNGGER